MGGVGGGVMGKNNCRQRIVRNGRGEREGVM